MSKTDTLLYLMKRRLKLILALSLTMIISIMGIVFFGGHLNKESQNFNIESKKHLYYSKQMTKMAMDLNKLQNDKAFDTTPLIEVEIERTRTKMRQLLGQVDKEIELLSQKSSKFDSAFFFSKNKVNTFKALILDLKHNWQPFRSAFLSVVEGEPFERQQALEYIENNYDVLYDTSDSIAQHATVLAREKDYIYITLACGLLVVAFIAIILQFAYIFRQIIFPLESVYKEMKLVGVSKMTLEIKPTSKNKNIYPVIDEINYKLKKLGWLISMIQNINNNDNFNDVLQFMYTSFSEFIPLNHIGIALIDSGGEALNLSYSITDGNMMPISDELLSHKMLLDESNLRSVLESGEPRVINDLEHHLESSGQYYYDQISLERGIKSSIAVPLKIDGNPLGFVIFSSIKKNAYNDEHIHFLETITDSIAISFNKNILISEILYGNSSALAKLAESRDHYTGEHLTRIKTYSWMIAKFLSVDSKYMNSMDAQYIQDVEKYSELHDIGKVAIEDGILMKPGKLTKEEFAIMKKHTIYGGRVLREAEANIQKGQKKILQMGIEIAECHHEKWNGNGYPYGLVGESIPLCARIVSVADVFDALTSERPYKKAMAFEVAFDIIKGGKGESFDPEIVDVFIKYEKAFKDALLVFNGGKA